MADAATARATAMPVLAGVLDAIAAGYCHQLGRWAEAEGLLSDLDPHRLDGIVQLVVGALLDADRGDRRACRRPPRDWSGPNTLGLRDGRHRRDAVPRPCRASVEPRPRRRRRCHRR